MMSLTAADSSRPRRIIVVVSNEPGGVDQVTTALGEAEINIEEIDGRLAGELGVIALNTDDDDAALHALLEAGLRAVSSDALVFHLLDRPGALAEVARLFSENQLQVRTIHILHRATGHAVVAVTTDNDDLARSVINSGSLI